VSGRAAGGFGSFSGCDMATRHEKIVALPASLARLY
jgi:methyl coenzyme M reductase beta subunit